MPTRDDYAYTVTWSADKEHIGLCAEFPSLSWISRSMTGAINGIRDLVADVLEDMETTGEDPPDPVRSYGCGCCGADLARDVFVWCAHCADHVLVEGPMHARTYYAQHGQHCPHQVSGFEL